MFFAGGWAPPPPPSCKNWLSHWRGRYISLNKRANVSPLLLGEERKAGEEGERGRIEAKKNGGSAEETSREGRGRATRGHKRRRFLATSATTKKQKLTPDVPLCVTDVRNRRLGTQKRENRDGDERIYTYIYIYIYIYTERGEYADGKSRRRRRKGGRGICYKGVVIGSGVER